MHKRVLAAVLAAILALSLAPAFADDASASLAAGETVSFPATVTAAAETSAEDWLSTESLRCLLTVGLWADLSNFLGEDSPYYPQIWETSFLAGGEGEDGAAFVFLVLQAENNTLFVFYWPDALPEFAFVTQVEKYEATLVEVMMRTQYPDAWWKNDLDTIVEVIDSLAGILSDQG